MKLIPILATVLGIGLAFWAIYWDHRKTRLQYEERRLMIEKGMAPPAGFPDERKRNAPEDCLRWGTILVCLGIGLGIGYFVLHTSTRYGPPDWLFGIGGTIVGFTGLGNLVYYFIARDRQATNSR